MTRKVTIMGTLVAMPHATVLPIKTNRQPLYRSRAPSVRASHADRGMTTALAIIYAVTTQRIVITSVPRSLIILGRTIFMTWLVKTLIYPPSTSDVMAHQRYAEEVNEPASALRAGLEAATWDEVLMLQ